MYLYTISICHLTVLGIVESSQQEGNKLKPSSIDRVDYYKPTLYTFWILPLVQRLCNLQYDSAMIVQSYIFFFMLTFFYYSGSLKVDMKPAELYIHTEQNQVPFSLCHYRIVCKPGALGKWRPHKDVLVCKPDLCSMPSSCTSTTPFLVCQS